MSEHMKCKVCGKVFYSAELFGGSNLFKESICPDCKRARAFNGGGGKSGGFSKGSSNAAEEAARREEQRRKAAAHKEAIQNIKNYEFPEDDSEFTRAVNNFCDDYCECNAGLMADRDYKKAYVKVAERELKNLRDTNSEHFEKFNELWQDAAASMKKRLKIKMIISGAILGVFVLLLGIFFAASQGQSFFSGAACGLVFGGIFAIIPHIVGKSKTSDE